MSVARHSHHIWQIFLKRKFQGEPNFTFLLAKGDIFFNSEWSEDSYI